MDSQTGYLQDGVQNVTLFTQSANMLASVEAIQQMTVIMNGADAHYAQPNIVNITTRGGTNRLHGSAFDFLQNDILNAENYNLTATNQSKTPLRYNLFGGTLGGPILHNRLFFFGSYQGLVREIPLTLQLEFQRVPNAVETSAPAQSLCTIPLLTRTAQTRSRYSPDGSKIAFVSDRSGTMQIWSASRDGSNLAQIAHLPDSWVGGLAWSPDSAFIAFDWRPQGHSSIA
jgi:WD40 repeat protein